MKVAIITTHLPPVMGGIEVHCEGLATALAQAGHEVVLCGSLEPGQDPRLRYEQRNQRLQVRRIPAVSHPRALRRPSRCWHLYRELRASHLESAFDVLHAHQLYPVGLAGAWIGRRLGVPLVVTEHGAILIHRRDWWKRALIRKAGNSAQAVLTASNELAAAASATGIPGDRISSVPNAISATQFKEAPSRVEARARLGIAPERFVVATVRRLVPKTGVRYAIQAVPHCLEALPRMLLLIVGEGPLRRELGGLVRELGIAENVQFVGGVDNQDVPLYVRAADLGVFPSLAEATSIAALEFMAASRPVVASSVGGLTDIIEDGQTGFLFDIGFHDSRYADPGLPAEAARRLAEAILRAYRSDLPAAGRAAAERIQQRHTWQAYVDRLEREFYAPVVGRRQ